MAFSPTCNMDIERRLELARSSASSIHWGALPSHMEAGHNVVMEIQATMPSTPQRPSKKPMWKGVIIANIIIGMCYIPVALVGFWIFGNAVNETLQKPKWLIATANMFVVLHLIRGYQIYTMPVFDMIEVVLVKKMKFKPTRFVRFISRTSYVVLIDHYTF